MLSSFYPSSSWWYCNYSNLGTIYVLNMFLTSCWTKVFISGPSWFTCDSSLFKRSTSLLRISFVPPKVVLPLKPLVLGDDLRFIPASLTGERRLTLGEPAGKCMPVDDLRWLAVRMLEWPLLMLSLWASLRKFELTFMALGDRFVSRKVFMFYDIFQIIIDYKT